MVIFLAIILVTQGRPTMVIFEEALWTIGVTFCTCARKYVPRPRAKNTD